MAALTIARESISAAGGQPLEGVAGGPLGAVVVG